MWKRPSKQIRDLMRRGAEMMVNMAPDQVDELQRATLESEYMQVIGGDPILAAAIRRGIWSTLLHWAAANISRPGEPVAANTGELSDIARGIARRGLRSPTSVDAYRLGQNMAWQFWMQIAFELTSDPAELRELLEVSALSMTSFIDATVTEVYRHLQIERDELASEVHAERRQIIAQILSGKAIHRHAAAQLGYHLGQQHTAAIVWGDEANIDPIDLDRAIEALWPTPDVRPILSVRIGPATRWVWLPGVGSLDVPTISAAVGKLPGVRIALGIPATGVEGFRRSHLDAVATQRMMMNRRSSTQVASFADIELVALVTSDASQADRFIKHTLGDFAAADRELQEAVLVYVHEQCNGSRAAERLFTHRNTLLRRISQAEELLPRPLAESSVSVAVALDALRWREDGP
ncbi:PucR family transcriptional regulator [Mycolicibacter icosiumassiliensis]|uniref:PucR family transcriptional regulator n=1 Tax=Mycolicibacter icosiumassiliensis TaxID=1792835 RepID=UPI001F32362C|nr:helix-turn-helix domain-containing protein [Mycolicibacter icosiumassiliensis]